MASDNKRKILSNIIAAVVVLLLLIIGARILLSVITRHNRTVTVPDFTNMDRLVGGFRSRRKGEGD